MGRITGKLVAQSRDVSVYVTDDERVIVHDEFKLDHWEVDNPAEELREFLEPGAYVDAMEAGAKGRFVIYDSIRSPPC